MFAKKSISITAAALLLSLGSQAMAASMECSIGLTTATAGGLMPMERTITLKASEVRPEAKMELSECTDSDILGMTVTLCAIEDGDALGVFHAELFINRDGGEELEFTSAKDIFAYSKKRAGALVSLFSEGTLTPQFMKKMDDANLTYPEYKGGDSLAIDDAVSAAFKKGVLNKNDIVSLSIESCRLK